MTSAHERYLGTRHFGSLDGLRCLSIVPVIWHHATPRPLPGIWGKGPAGVDLFFCISGYLITTLLVREKAQTGRIALGDFYIRRALRIWPLYYALLAAYALFAAFAPHSIAQSTHFFRTLPLYATFTANWFGNWAVPFPILFSFAWSLCIEEQFYAFWPWLVRALSVRRAFFAMGAFIAVDALAEHGAFSPWLAPSVLRVVTSFAAPIGLGALFALALDQRRSFDWLAIALRRSWSAPLALGATLVLLCWPSAPLFAFQASLAALVCACVMREDNGLAPLLRARPIAYVGALSYGGYLLNSTAIGLVRRILPSQIEHAGVIFWLSLPPLLGLAALSHRYAEAPFLALRRHFRPAISAPEIAAPPLAAPLP